MHATATITHTGGQPPEVAPMLGEEMERWLRELDGFEGLLVLAGDERSIGVTFWASAEAAERHAVARAEFRDRMLGIAGVEIEEIVDFDVAFARLGPGFASALQP